MCGMQFNESGYSNSKIEENKASVKVVILIRLKEENIITDGA